MPPPASFLISLGFLCVAIAAAITNRGEVIRERRHVPWIGILSSLGAISFALLPLAPIFAYGGAVTMLGTGVIMLRVSQVIRNQPSVEDMDIMKRAELMAMRARTLKENEVMHRESHYREVLKARIEERSPALRSSSNSG